MGFIERNRELTSTLVKRTDQFKLRQINALKTSGLMDRHEKLKSDTRIAKKRWRIMKSLMAGMVVGSGIDWAIDPRLKSLVIDEDE